ncbi:N-acetylmuramoyl-L-alanine amidase [Cytobacillus depressus]|uniref:N-acetylmuramoyl-L-alanine amidase n=1 Tax=Cytobacillus depressus TaxID=1602942 RepID=A0A6L3VB49_9BACI|nr:N-acetylmuramoyl-L-alanine amidase [Cytobacillus depressus]KAB2337753.1 N-acetylmuramoyl-L-alanine amidase [Cytobacillus depressus]
MINIFIDPGHGGTDPGAVGNGLLEKVLTLTISKRIRDILTQYENVLVKLSREDDQTLSLKQRTDMANAWGADYLLSVHINAGGGTGYEDFIYPGLGGATAVFQNAIHEEIMKQVDFFDRGKKQANFHMLRESKMPALLTENGFIDNSSDAAKLKQAAFIDKIAQGHVNGLDKAFGLKKKEETKVEVAAVVEPNAKVLFNDSNPIPAIIKDGRTYVQVREFAELLGLKVIYNNESKTTKLYTVK